MAQALRLVSVDGAFVDRPKQSVASLYDLQAAIIKAAADLDQISARARLIAITLKLTALQAEAAALSRLLGPHLRSPRENEKQQFSH